MTVAIKQWNAARLLAKVATTLEKSGAVYSETAVLQMSNPIWDWDWATLRFESLLMGGTREPGRLGVIVGDGPRDIVDTGRLLDSMTKPLVIRERGKASMVIAWTAPYAERVRTGGYYGSYINPRGQEVTVGYRPGRDWIAATFKARPAEQVFVDIWRSFKGT